MFQLYFWHLEIKFLSTLLYMYFRFAFCVIYLGPISPTLVKLING